MTAFWSAIVNSAILSAALAAAVWCILRIAPRRKLNAATRCAIWWLVLAATLALPLSSVKWTPANRAPLHEFRQPPTSNFPLTPTAPILGRTALPLAIPASPALRPLLVFWIVSALLLLIRVAFSYAALYRRSGRAAAPPPELAGRVQQWLAQSGSARKHVRLAISAEIDIPVATGPFRSAILIPSQLFAVIDDGDLNQIGLHEAAHLARRDDYALFLQRIVEAIFALHPVVRWLTRQIDLEREIACDDIVARSSEQARTYADCLTRTVVLCGGVRTSLAAANVADSRSHLSLRVELLVNKSRTAQTRVLITRLIPIAAAVICVAALLTKTPQLVAFPAPQAAVPQNPLDAPSPAPAQSPFAQQSQAGIQQLKTRQFDGAIATFQRLIDETTDTKLQAELWALIYQAYRDMGDFAKGIQAMGHAVALLPNNASYLTNLALLYESQNDNAHALQYYQRALAIDPNNPLVLNNLAYLLAETGGDLDQALTYARKAQLKLPNFIEVNDTIGYIYLKKNMPDDAAGAFKVLIDAAPNVAEYHYHYALALYQQGNLTDALKQCKTARALKPSAAMGAEIRALTDKIAPEYDPLPPQPAGDNKLKK